MKWIENNEVKVRINHLDNGDNHIDDHYDGKEGYVSFIDDNGYLHGSWGGVAIIPNHDDYTIIEGNDLLDDMI